MQKLFFTILALIVISCFPKLSITETILFISNIDNDNSTSHTTHVGKVFVTDGDTIKKGKLKIRLHGIDAPEIEQTCKNSDSEVYACGLKSTNFLKSLINNNNVYCEKKNKDRYNRLIAICHANNINLNSAMVKEGWAIAYRYYSADYINEENSAKKNNKGIWGGSFIEPYIWRKNN